MVARSAGTFLGGFFNNPGLVAIALGIGALLVFRKPITEAFANFKLPDINLPDVNFGDFKFPDFDFKFPDFNLDFGGFDFGDPLKAIQDSIDKIVVQFSNLDKPGREMGTTPDPDVIPVFGGGLAERREGLEDPVITVDEMDLPPSTLDPNRPLSLDQLAAFQDPIVESLGKVQSAIPDQQFQGGGLSFIGGSVSETPLQFQSLGQITERLGISASRAASLRAEAIGFTPTEQAFLTQGQEISPLGDFSSQPQTSGGFEGLTPEQIALRLTGGIISNF